MSSQPILPEELISLILGSLNAKDDQDTIHSLRLASKTLCRLATPYIYRKIQLGLPLPGNQPKSEHSERNRALLHNLLSYLERASFVKEITVLSSNGGRLRGQEAKKEDKRKVDFERHGGSLEAVVKEAAERGFVKGAEIAYFLLVCKDLEVLRTDLAYGNLGKLPVHVLETITRQHLQATMRSCDPKPEALRCLREVSVGHRIYQTSPENVLTLLCLPALHKLSIFGLSDRGKLSAREAVVNEGIIRNRNPISVVLDSFMPSSSGLDAILATCSNTKALTIRWRAGTWNEHFANQEACDILRRRAKTLETLHYDCVELFEWRRPPTGYGTFGSFAELNVKTLAVPKAYFDHLREFPAERRATYAAQLIPIGLKKLYVLGVEEDEVADVMSMIGTDVIPGLEKSVCVPWKHETLEDHYVIHVRHVDYDRVGGFDLRTQG